MLTEIYLCHDCSCHEISRMETPPGQDTERSAFDLMGYSLRTDEYRITEYRQWDGGGLHGRWDLPPNATELYHHPAPAAAAERKGADGSSSLSADPFASESVNLAGRPDMAPVLARLRAQLRQRFTASSSAAAEAAP
jgi:hypothetical protein